MYFGRSYNNGENKSPGGGIIVALLIAAGVMFILQDQIAYWKAANANINHAQIVNPPQHPDQASSFAFITGTIQSTTALRDPLRGVLWPQLAALKITEETYRRGGGRRSSSSWKTDNTFQATTPTQLNGLQLGDAILRQGGRELWAPLNLSQVPAAQYLTTFGSTDIRSNMVYTHSRHRYVYSAITTPQTVTLVGALLTSAESATPVLALSPSMPKGYSALWPGQLSPAQFLATLKLRMIGTLLAVGGVQFFMGWMVLALINALTGRQLSTLSCAFAASGAAMGSMMLWFITVNWLLAMPAWLGLTAALYMLLRFSSPTLETR